MTALHEQISTLIGDASKDHLHGILAPHPADAYVKKLLEHAELATWYSEGTMSGLVAFYANDPAGETAFVTMVAVAPEKRRARIAKSLLEAVLMSVSARGFRQCRLEVHPGNAGAIALYHALGFKRLSATDLLVTMELKLPLAGSPDTVSTEK